MQPELMEAITNFEKAGSDLETAYGVKDSKDQTVINIQAKLDSAVQEQTAAGTDVNTAIVNFDTRADELSTAVLASKIPLPVVP